MNYKHGARHTNLYGIWSKMKGRCLNKNDAAYKNYGGRGILISEEWEKSFEAFSKDMGQPPLGMTLERVNNELGYSRDNCVWASRKTQSRNRRGLLHLTVDGETKTAGEWAEISGIELKTLCKRISCGWTHEAAVKTPLIKLRSGIPRGKALHLYAIGREAEQ